MLDSKNKATVTSVRKTTERKKGNKSKLKRKSTTVVIGVGGYSKKI